jgi:Tol biopolymer transport system component
MAAMGVITSGPSGDFRPAWSPDSSKVGFDRDCAIYTVNRDGSGLTKLIIRARCVGDAAWSPDGTEIGFWNSDTLALQAFDLRTKKVTTIATGAALGDDPSAERLAGWSPDGQWLAVGACCDISGGVGMVLESADGSMIVPVPNADHGMAAAWHA